MPETELIGLSQAADLLGIHTSTLREWADRGEIPSTRTAGGHRRFRRSELNAWSQTTKPASLPGAEVLVHSALGRARFDLTDGILNQQAWYGRMDAEARKAHRETGRRLLALLLKFLSNHAAADETLREAREVGVEYERLGRVCGLSLPETVRAYLFFRDYLFQSAFDTLAASAVTPHSFQTWRELQNRVKRFTDEVLIALIEAHEPGVR